MTPRLVLIWGRVGGLEGMVWGEHTGGRKREGEKAGTISWAVPWGGWWQGWGRMGERLHERCFSGLVGSWDLPAQVRKQVVLTRWGGGEESSQVRLGDTREGAGQV